ncbi:hypothetical protein ACFE04_028581 [Oxalis oulophora]
MGFRLPRINSAKKTLQRSLSRGSSTDVTKGYLAIYVGESQMKRFVVPISYLNHPEFQSLLSQSEDEFGFDHPMGGLTLGSASDVLKGYLAIYVEESQMKRFVIPISYLTNPDFQNSLTQSEEEFGFNHPMGGLTIPCTGDIFTDLISRLDGSS